ncbi:YveK family protein [Companilactobacillus bobalius]|uniref:Capsular polysaccharide biosynthesis protein CpsC n=2 Tax=Companilactobacillus bobalius TaxID=2801451 RepID=A0A202F9J3_9LACO|nr:Wzz/FepE/Etk N-terminal domain-containing protein [Companilactobacillus bobalius]GEO58581.1 chain-length determining protein [Companilactobacillus paralimentarius]KAE9557482.1 chain-length determining protein [Companilactobacillus bobalius]KAE9561553.1 chain-length determining protein [Companilactobacillus bobalius]KAE9563629.1 chain-length determining protein [Companilactobacillus bobalius]KRK82451.1 capsular polysaccharide biosynthesis protein [Companilactobacillus bobalius DSM 19674]
MESEQNISMMQIVGILRKHIKAIFGTTIVVTLAAIFVTFFVMTPKYSATTQILVNRKLSDDMQSAQFQQVQADVQMISTYKDIITSPTVLRDVNKEVSAYPGYPGSINALKSSLSISNAQNSQVFSVTAKSSDAGTAAAIANMTAKVFKKKVVKIMSVNNVSIVSEATANTKPVSPRKALNVIAGVIIGLILGIALAFIRELTDRTVSTETFLTDDLGLTSLGTVAEIDQKDIERTVEHKKVQSKLSINKSSRNHRRV